MAPAPNGTALATAWRMSEITKGRAQACRRAGAVICLITVGALQQGCLAAAWVAAVSADSMRAGDVHFHPFEESWVSKERPTAIADRPSLTSVALMPVEGDEAMGARLTKVLQHETTLRVVTPAGRDGWLSAATTDRDRAVLARTLSRELAVDAVLYGHVVGVAAQSSEWGWKAEEPRRLFLYMIDRDGHLLWKDELPFLIVTGTKPPPEESVQLSLTRHFMDHVRDLGLDDVGYFPSKSI
jgi:hypothetical protein